MTMGWLVADHAFDALDALDERQREHISSPRLNTHLSASPRSSSRQDALAAFEYDVDVAACSRRVISKTVFAGLRRTRLP